MSSEVFETREDELHNLVQDLKQKLQTKIPKCTGEEKKKVIRDVQRGVENGHILLQEMEEELKNAPTAFRSQMISKVRNYHKDLEQINKQLKQNSEGPPSGRQNRGFGMEDELENMASSQRARLLAGNESLTRASDSIARSQRVAAETDHIGYDIIDELGTQRESLTRTRDRLIDTDENLSKSRRILNTMRRRLMTNKLILGVVILVELGVLGGLVYWKFFS